MLLAPSSSGFHQVHRTKSKQRPVLRIAAMRHPIPSSVGLPSLSQEVFFLGVFKGAMEMSRAKLAAPVKYRHKSNQEAYQRF